MVELQVALLAQGPAGTAPCLGERSATLPQVATKQSNHTHHASYMLHRCVRVGSGSELQVRSSPLLAMPLQLLRHAHKIMMEILQQLGL